MPADRHYCGATGNLQDGTKRRNHLRATQNDICKGTLHALTHEIRVHCIDTGDHLHNSLREGKDTRAGAGTMRSSGCHRAQASASNVNTERSHSRKVLPSSVAI